MLARWKKSYDTPKQHFNKQRHHFADKSLYSQSYGFSSSHVWMWELDYKEDWAPKNWRFWIVGLEKILESPLDCKEIQPVSPKGNQPWTFTRRTDTKAESPILWPPDGKSRLTGKDSDAGKDLRAGGEGGDRMNWLDSITDSIDMNLNKLQETVKDRETWLAVVYEIANNWTRLSDWTAPFYIRDLSIPGFRGGVGLYFSYLLRVLLQGANEIWLGKCFPLYKVPPVLRFYIWVANGVIFIHVTSSDFIENKKLLK